jgi:hypothetical protein
MKQISALSDLQPDPKNANKGTVRGHKLVKESLHKYGAGRSILVDRNGQIIAGNKTAANAQAAGLDESVILVPSDGTKLVVVQRTDLEASDPVAKQLAVADNRAAEIGLEWDPAVLSEFPAEELQPFFTAAELDDLSGEQPTPSDPNAEWVGMPEYGNTNVAARDIIVHFKSESAVQEFASLLGQTITDKTKYLWYPKEEKADAASYKYVAQSECK